MDVSRETAAAVFGPGLPVAEAYAELLAGPGVDRGLIGPREADRLWHRHLINCAVVAPAIPEAGQVVDVGSGAGLPGIPIAIVRPRLRIRLVEPLLRRATFLEEAVGLLGLTNVEVSRCRAEDLAGAGVPVATARAVAPLDRLARWCLPMLGPGGVLLALKGAQAATELAAAAPELSELGARSWSVEEHGRGLIDPPVRVVRITAGPGVAVARRRKIPSRPARPRLPGAGDGSG
jgi:16S rRNA (guanine527-N7)-methyltransferase